MLYRSLGLSLHLVAPALAQEPAPEAPPIEFFHSRRQALMERLGEGVVLVRSAPKPAHMGNFVQGHEFYYLTGVAEPDIAVLLLPEKKHDVLLVPPFNRFTATWDGDRLVPGEEAAERTGFAEVRNSRRLMAELDELLAPDDSGKRPPLWVLFSPQPIGTATINSAMQAAQLQARDPLDGRPSRPEILQERLVERFPGLELRDLTPYLNELRGVKTEAEVAQIARSTDVAAQGIAEAMKSTRPGLYEYQIAAVARYVFSRLGAGADAYAAIVGAGANGCVLHYSANSKQLVAEDLIVMDYGATVHGYATDVTRTFPADGKFSPEQRELVLDVWEIQQELISMVKPGARISDISRRCGEMLSERGYRADHGPCHHVGLAVHDMGPDELAPGMVLTVEPGAYLRDEGMGCRIEDTILVTAEGHRNLSGHLPSHPDAIEKLMAAEGIAQVPVGLR